MSNKNFNIDYSDEQTHFQRKVLNYKKKIKNPELTNFTYKKSEPYKKPKQKLSINNFYE